MTKYSVIELLFPLISKEHNTLIFKGWGIQEMSENTNLATNRHIADGPNCWKTPA